MSQVPFDGSSVPNSLQPKPLIASPIMSRSVRFWLLAGVALLLVLASWMFFLHLWNDTYWCDEKYCLVAAEGLGQMNLSFEDDDYFSELVGPTIYAIGTDERYLVLKQHPGKGESGAFDRTVTNFYIVERTASSNLEDRQKGVRGPLTQEEFEKLAVSLSLPKFSKTFPELE